MTNLDRLLAAINRTYWLCHCYVCGNDHGLHKTATLSIEAAQREENERQRARRIGRDRNEHTNL